jgi:hypothetical protein
VDSATNRQNLGLEIGVDVQSFDADTTKNDVANTFTANQIISVTDNTNAALRVTQLGTGNALVVEDSTNPDSTPFVVDASGNCGIGTSIPSSSLNINNGFIQVDINGTQSIRVGSTDSILGGTDNEAIFQSNTGKGMRFFSGGTERMRIDSSGNIGAPSGTNIYNASDQRLKQNITDLSGCLQKVLLMRGVSFNWIDNFCDSEADKTLYGLIAQELQTVDVNLVDSFSDNTITAGEVTVENPLRVNEKFIIPMLVESIKEQQALIESQQSQIDALAARIEALETP